MFVRAPLGDCVALALPECTSRPLGVSLANEYHDSCWVSDLSCLFCSVSFSLGSASEDVIVPFLCEMCELWRVG